MNSDFWTWLHAAADDTVEAADLGLIAEARRLAEEAGGGTVTVAAAGEGAEGVFDQLGGLGVDKIVHLASPHLNTYHGDVFARELLSAMERHSPAALLMVHNERAMDLAGRLGALSGWAVITRAVDAHADGLGHMRVERPIANGYLFETLESVKPGTQVVTFMPAVLADPAPIRNASAEIQVVSSNVDPAGFDTKIVEMIAADPETLDIEDADIVVVGGRGVGRGDAFNVIHRLALAMGGAVAGTRPVIDWQILPFERQIGQTGRSVAPRLIVNCGISGANEYTAGIEKSQRIIAVNNDPLARIFQFADLCIVGDLHQVLPLLIKRLEEMAEQNDL